MPGYYIGIKPDKACRSSMAIEHGDAEKMVNVIATIQELKVIRAYLKSVNRISKYRIKLRLWRNNSFNAIDRNKSGDNGILYHNKNIYISLKKLMAMVLAKQQFFISTPSHTYSEHL
ncbi:MAG: hypothetical protein ACRC2V_01330 [Xenococcaceae cyanobacterium]